MPLSPGVKRGLAVVNYNSALVIDDDLLFQVVAEEVLYALGLSEVSTADDGHLGLKMLAVNMT